jgi:hypothetical protein
VRALVGQYYVVLRSVLRRKPKLRPCLRRCQHCRIFFLSHARNRGRRDLRCPMGCREAHRKRRSTERSVAYYGTAEGKEKKKVQNGKRAGRGKGRAEASRGGREQPPEGEEIRLEAGIVSYVRMVTSLMEGRRVSVAEVGAMLQRAVRQHRMVRRRRIDYVVAYLKKNAP